MKSPSCCSKIIIYISERTSLIWEFLHGDAAPVRKMKLLVQREGEGVPLEITVEVCSMLPERLTCF